MSDIEAVRLLTACLDVQNVTGGDFVRCGVCPECVADVALSRIERDLNDTWKAAEDAGLRADRNSDYLAKVNRVVEAAREAERHLTFNGWKDDPNSDRRFAAVTTLREALGALDG